MRPLNQFQRYLVHEFVDDYNDGVMTRRDMVARVMHITGSAAAAATLLTQLGVQATDAMQPVKLLRQGSGEPQSPFSVSEDDPDIAATEVTYPGANGDEITAYEARPAAGGATPAPGPEASASPVAGGMPLIMVCHENRGLTEHIRDVARRLAKAGYAAVAPDLVSHDGGTAANSPDEIPGLLSNADPMRHVQDFQGAVTYYESQDGIDIARLGMIGFCFGGGVTWRSATQIPALKAAVPFYGPPPPLEDVPNIKAAVLGIYSSDPGDFANEGREDLEQALRDAGVTFEIREYPDTEHAFHNDTGPRYNAEQAQAAWRDTLSWLGQYV
jgi:carboxymethylenebutenolidase